MGRLDGRVAIVTGAGNGLGRAHALYLAANGARVVVNDLGASVHGEGSSSAAADAVVAEIRAAGGQATASGDDVADWEQAGRLVEAAISEFGDLHVLVNNAGILRDRTLANMAEAEWDAVIRVHLKGHAAPSHHAMAYWRRRAKAGAEVKASVVHTSSVAGYAGNFGQANYASAKAAVIGLSKVVALEGTSLGVRSNVISPSARTRLALADRPPEEQARLMAQPDGGFDHLDPANVSPLVGWLAEASCPANGQIFHLIGGRLFLLRMPCIERTLSQDGRWSWESLDRELAPRLVEQPGLDVFFMEDAPARG